MIKRSDLPLRAVQAMQKAMSMPGVDARTLLMIGLEAWPGKDVMPFGDGVTRLRLPLTENPDDKA